MPKIYVDANPSYAAYVIDGGGSDHTRLPPGHTAMEAEYLAVIYGLNQFFLKWNKELDARQYNMTKESKDTDEGFFKVATPSEETPRQLPPPILICSDNEVVVKQLSRQYHIGNARLRKLAQQVWQMCQNLEVKFEWVSRKENLAGKMLP
ncbi:hypothetical protein LCGC14_0947420 [marine sediment metagenome]|uniref:RNase H type-1 domain-containing protein n=1 Tax=marine sediment metagenome TaxID=412755 RepID=A0A0F9P4G4_9ZZZZ